MHVLIKYIIDISFSDINANDTMEVLRLDSLHNDGVTHSALLEVFNVPEFTRILFYGT